MLTFPSRLLLLLDDNNLRRKHGTVQYAWNILSIGYSLSKQINCLIRVFRPNTARVTKLPNERILYLLPTAMVWQTRAPESRREIVDVCGRWVKEICMSDKCAHWRTSRPDEKVVLCKILRRSFAMKLLYLGKLN